MKRALLAMEGVRFDAAGRVVCGRFHYEPRRRRREPERRP